MRLSKAPRYTCLCPCRGLCFTSAMHTPFKAMANSTEMRLRLPWMSSSPLMSSRRIAFPGPRVESATTIMAMGLDGSLDDAFKTATANMANWLTSEHHLTPQEVAEVLGSVAQYKVSEAADRNAGVVLRIDKGRLASLIDEKAR